MFGFLKAKVASFFNYFSSKIASFFGSNRRVDDSFFSDLEDVLIGADVGSQKSREFVELLKKEALSGATSADLKVCLQGLMRENLEKFPLAESLPKIVLVVGINGAGKTSFIGKYAKRLTDLGKKVLIVAADTFRAAAVDQLAEWADRSGADFFDGQGRQDPAAVVFDGCRKFVKDSFDHVVIDTAGRVQSKEHLMRELHKIHKVIEKAAPGVGLSTWIVIDGTLGQNSLEQAKIFNEAVQLNGIILTKLDSSARGGIVFAISDALKIPVVYMSHGESIADISLFSSDSYVRGIFDA